MNIRPYKAKEVRVDVFNIYMLILTPNTPWADMKKRQR